MDDTKSFCNADIMDLPTIDKSFRGEKMQCPFIFGYTVFFGP
jgi:hypothetical protein